MKPYIGITTQLDIQPTRRMNTVDQDYGKAVLQAGGIPVPILSIEESVPDLVRHCNGFLFTGGDDINPRFYKEKPLDGVRLSISPDERTSFEIRLFRAAARARKPILAICHGMQLVNVALGGTLYQDIGLQIMRPLPHRPERTGQKTFHHVDMLEGTRLEKIMGASRIRVRSSHHQSVKHPGRGLHLSAAADDRVIEALEPRADQFLIAVQWHPEKTLHDRYTKKLFRALVKASAA